MSVKLRRLWIQLTADRRRFGALCAVLGVGMLLWARLIVVSRMPRMAVADDASLAANSGEKPAKFAAKSEKADKTSEESAPPIDREPVPISLMNRFGRDPFIISPHYFPKPTSFTEPGKEADKSQSKPAEEGNQIEARLTAQLQAAADRLRLEAAVSGSLVVISGKTYRVGDVIEAPVQGGELARFKLVEVRHRSAVLECEQRQFEIQMTSPGN
jgi:hypothetical protein